MNKSRKKKLIEMQLGSKIRPDKVSKNAVGRNHAKAAFYHLLREVKESWGYNDVEEVIRYMMSRNSKNFNMFKSCLFPKSYEVLNKGEFLSYQKDAINRELIWCAILFECNNKIINDYVQLKSKYENYLLNGEYEHAEHILDQIESEMGKSIWGLDNRFILNEYRGGLESNKKFLASMNSIKCDSWITLLSDLFSFKAEKGINDRQYNQRITKIIERISDENKPFFKEKLFPLYTLRLDEIYDLLYFNSSASLIDMYNTYLVACTRITSDDNSVSYLKKSVGESLNHIKHIEDVVIKKLKLTYMDNVTIEFNDFDGKLVYIGGLYTEGKYDEVIREIDELILTKANCFELYEYYVKSYVMKSMPIRVRNSVTLKQEIINAMYISYVRGDNTPEAYIILNKISRLFTNSYMGTGLAYFIIDKYMFGTSKLLYKSREYYSQFINLRLTNAMPMNNEQIIECFENEFGTNSLLEFDKIKYTDKILVEGKHVDSTRQRWYKIKKDILNEGEDVHVEMSKWIKELSNSNEPFHIYMKERISTELYYFYIRKMMCLDAEVLYVNNYINSKYSTLRMDLNILFDTSKPMNQLMKSNICTPIATYINNKNDYSGIYSATANFLDSNGFDKPSDIIECDGCFQEKELIFFLRYVCKSEILDSMYNIFETDDDVEDERILLCQFLQKIDDKNGNVYIDEISQIMQRKKILDGINYLENVKIDLDIKKIIEGHTEIFTDNYNRLKLIGDLEIEYKALDSMKFAIVKYSDAKKYNFKLITLKEMLIDFRDELVFGNYGLDPTIGTRIRHGSLQNQMRVAFEKNNIVFVRKSTEEKVYVATKDFNNICNGLSSKSKRELYSYISEFSESLDKYIEKLKLDLIRIKTEEKNPEGLIDLSISMVDVSKIFKHIGKLQNENLVLEVFEEYWIKRIEDGLKCTKQYFLNEIKKKIIEMLNQLEERLYSISGIEDISYSFFDSISRTRTEFQNNLDIMIEWFKLPTKQEYEDFDALSLVETCEMINKRVFTNYNLAKVKKTIKVKKKFKGRSFSYLVDIMIIQFSNAYFHSGYVDDVRNLSIELKIEEYEDYVEIYMVNNIADTVNREELVNIISELNEKLNECIVKREYYNYEGKSGYIKICKILDYNLHMRIKLDFGIDCKMNNFHSHIKLDKSILL